MLPGSHSPRAPDPSSTPPQPLALTHPTPGSRQGEANLLRHVCAFSGHLINSGCWHPRGAEELVNTKVLGGRCRDPEPERAMSLSLLLCGTRGRGKRPRGSWKTPRGQGKEKGGPPFRDQCPAPVFWPLGQILQNPFPIFCIIGCNLLNIFYFLKETWRTWIQTVNSTSSLPLNLKMLHAGRTRGEAVLGDGEV